MPVLGLRTAGGFRLLARRRRNLSLSVTMNKSSHAIREEYVDLAWLDDRRHFSHTKGWMHQRLSSTIGLGLIVRRACLTGRACAGRASTAFVRNARAAYWATDACNATFLGDGSDDMSALFTTGYAHLINSISHRKGLFLCCHIPPN